MIEHIDRMLRHLLISRIDHLTDEAQVRFQPPDADWRTYVANLSHLALNVYLLELRENRALRTNERSRGTAAGLVAGELAPRRVDLHYLITAWSAAAPSQVIEPTLDEHALLYRAAATLVAAEPLNPAEIYRPGPLPTGFPEPLADAVLPTSVLPAEGFSKYAEFWGTMDGRPPWRPGVHLTVTVPVCFGPGELGPLVTTQMTGFEQPGQAGAEVVFHIGGSVLDAGGVPVPGAWVRVETPDGSPRHTTETTVQGRYTVGRLTAGRYRLRVRVTGLGERVREIELPGAAGDHDVTFG
ncbi:Pvc16 family protein [Nonomuraea jiangxiensis]|uniref:Carboxypeptidase regulatory-like domain-containing protein n=1 Tax=Nonomuraea jiangxiensis TaxID=633440 RepID=A0A1G9P8L6_9ACTN|nr:Pvc16 family protein [Nonomuraea jiangxiensis]SDL95212.1 Carboxypeptidase regulatory-like domain-containing protein [Nonomuraea jiangxiensis]